MRKETSGLKASTLILLVLLVISAVFVILVETGTFKINRNNNKIVECKNLKEALSKVDFEVEVPDFILNKSELEYRVSNSNFVEIGCSELVFKAAKLVDFKADPLALYKEAKEEYEYSLVNSDIAYLRIRLKYKGMENCTIINWVKGETAYGLALNSTYNEEELLNILGINKENLIEYGDKEEDNTDINIEYSSVVIANKINVNLPKFKTSFKTVDLEGYTICYIDNKKVFVFVYDDYNIDSDTFGGQSEVIINDSIVLRYVSENPFTEGTDAYIDYKTFMDTINNIISSIKYQ